MLRFGFVTCVQLGLACMREIYAAGGRLVFAATLADHVAPAKSGRVYLDEFCGEHGIALTKVGNINDAGAVEAVRSADLDWLFVIGWSQIARREVLHAPRRGVLGMHPSLLPVGRGRAAVPWAILLGLEETGVTLFRLDEGVDSGPIGAQVRLPVAARETATSLYQRVEAAHRELIRTHWPALAAGTLAFTPQVEANATYWPGRTPEQGRLDPSMTVAEAERLVRAVTHPYPGAFIDLEGRRLRVWEAVEVSPKEATGDPPGLRLAFVDGLLAVKRSQWEA